MVLQWLLSMRDHVCSIIDPRASRIQAHDQGLAEMLRCSLVIRTHEQLLVDPHDILLVL